jgi:hypothetical protein
MQPKPKINKLMTIESEQSGVDSSHLKQVPKTTTHAKKPSDSKLPVKTKNTASSGSITPRVNGQLHSTETVASLNKRKVKPPGVKVTQRFQKSVSNKSLQNSPSIVKPAPSIELTNSEQSPQPKPNLNKRPVSP